MAEISAAAVKSLRERTGLPMMDCKKALQRGGGDADKAVELLRKAGAKMMEKRAGRATTSGRIAVYVAPDASRGAMIDLRCESPGGRQRAVRATGQRPGPATGHRPRRRFARGTPGPAVAQQERADAEAAVRRSEQPHPRGVQARADRPDRRPLRRLRPPQRRGRRAAAISRAATASWPRTSACTSPPCGRPCWRKEELDPAVVAKEREILSEAARKEGKPENIIDKMVEGRLRNFYAECCLAEQPFVKDDKKTVGQAAKEAGMKLVRFVRWELPKE